MTFSMKNFYFILIFFASISYNAQDNRLTGNWILENIKYTNGKSLEVNHPLYSTFLEYNFFENKLSINDNVIPYSIENNKIVTSSGKINFKFSDNYLIINNENTDLAYYFLSSENFLKTHPEFEPKQISNNNRIVYLENQIVKPIFKGDGSFNNYLSDHNADTTNIPSNSEFSIKFIINSKNKIENIEIIKSVSNAFDSKFIQNLKSSEQYINNFSSKDLLITRKYIYNSNQYKKNNVKKSIDKILVEGNKYFQKNDFNNAIKSWSKLESLEYSPEEKYLLDTALIKLGISYLAIGKQEDACKTFKKVGDLTNFRVRNFLINYCN